MKYLNLEQTKKALGVTTRQAVHSAAKRHNWRRKAGGFYHQADIKAYIRKQTQFYSTPQVLSLLGLSVGAYSLVKRLARQYGWERTEKPLGYLKADVDKFAKRFNAHEPITEISKRLGVSSHVVRQRAKKEGWSAMTDVVPHRFIVPEEEEADGDNNR